MYNMYREIILYTICVCIHFKKEEKGPLTSEEEEEEEGEGEVVEEKVGEE